MSDILNNMIKITKKIQKKNKLKWDRSESKRKNH